MKIAVCDDEPIFRKQLKAILEEYYCSLDVLVLSYSSGEELLGAVKGNPFDLVFLDIEMEGIDGLETAKRLNELVSDLPVILLTSHTELAMEGYEVRAFRFLGKPVDKRKLQEALGAFEKLRQQEQKIEIVTEGGSRYLSPAVIRYIKSENVYLQIVTGEQSFLVRKTLKEQLRELPEDLFVMVHRSYIVNLNETAGFDGETVTLRDGSRIPVSRGKREMFRLRMLQFMKKR